MDEKWIPDPSKVKEWVPVIEISTYKDIFGNEKTNVVFTDKKVPHFYKRIDDAKWYCRNADDKDKCLIEQIAIIKKWDPFYKCMSNHRSGIPQCMLGFETDIEPDDGTLPYKPR